MKHIFVLLQTKFSALTMTLLWPGAGHLSIGALYLGSGFTLFPFFACFILAINRKITTPEGIFILAALILANYLLAFIHLTLLLSNKLCSSPKNVFISVCGVLSSLTLCFLLYFSKAKILGVQIYVISSHSMTPTLAPGDFILVDTWQYKKSHIQKNDIITFRQNNKTYVKRVVAIENDQVSYRGDNILINKKDIHQKNMVITNVQKDTVFVVGDNIHASYDSRRYGAINISTVTGKAKVLINNLSNL